MCRGVGPTVFVVGVCRGVGLAKFAGVWRCGSCSVCRCVEVWVLLCLQEVCVEVRVLLCL